jgi:hypothetical protein
MICDKCDGEVEPQNNALLYDAALAALVQNKSVPIATFDTHDALDRGKVTGKSILYQQGYVPMVDATFTDFPVFRQGEIVHGNPVQSVINAMRTKGRGRHLYGTDNCEGSPSRRRNIEEGVWGSGTPMGELAQLAQQAYEVIQSIDTPAPSKK